VIRNINLQIMSRPLQYMSWSADIAALVTLNPHDRLKGAVAVVAIPAMIGWLSATMSIVAPWPPLQRAELASVCRSAPTESAKLLLVLITYALSLQWACGALGAVLASCRSRRKAGQEIHEGFRFT
jgi:hypothetical protein